VIEVYRRPLEQHARAPGYDGWRVLDQAAFRRLEDATTLQASALLSPGWTLSVSADGASPERLEASFVSANYFELLGARLARGGGFDAARDEGGPSPVVVLSHSYWQRRFGGDPGILGRSLRVEGRDLAVVGVASRDFVGTSVARAPDVWIPDSMIEVIPLWGARAATTGMFLGVARLRDGATLAAAETELARLGEEHYGAQGGTFRVAPLRQVTVDPNRRAGFVGTLSVLSAAAVLLLFIACLNVANLLLARSIRRQRELAVRVALGAGKTRLARQLFTESIVPYAIGGVGGVALLVALRPWLAGVRPPGRFFFSNPTLELPVDVRVLAFTLLATGLCAVVFGTLPVWRVLRSDPRRSLSPYASSPLPRAIRVRDTLVVLQVAFCLVALAGAGLFLRGVQAARAIDPGFDPRNVGMISVNLHYAGYERDDQHAFYRRAVDAALSVPAVTAAGMSWLRPLEFGPVYVLWTYPDAPPEARHSVRATAITPGYLEAAGVPLLAGRDFRASDRLDTGVSPADASYVVILNERAAELAWPGEPPANAIGRTVYGGFVAGPSAEVIGVVPTGRQVSMAEEPTPAVFTSLEQMRTVPTATLFFRTTGPPERAMQTVAARLRQIDPAVPIHDIEAAEALVDRALWGVRASAGLLAAIAAVGLLLAALGVYGVIASMVGERRREVGIRLALGAGRGRVYHLVIGRVVVVVGAGIIIGIGVVAAAGRVTAGLLYGVAPTDRPTLAAVAACLLLVALLAAFLPARQATRVDPLEVLRGD
jgi:putative ABC transport system permease protein